MTNNSRLQLFNDAKKIKGKKTNLISNKNVKKNLNMVNPNMGTFRTNFKLQLHINMRTPNFTSTYAINKNFRTLNMTTFNQINFNFNMARPCNFNEDIKNSQFQIFFSKIMIRAHNLKTRVSKFSNEDSNKTLNFTEEILL